MDSPRLLINTYIVTSVKTKSSKILLTIDVFKARRNKCIFSIKKKVHVFYSHAYSQ